MKKRKVSSFSNRHLYRISNQITKAELNDIKHSIIENPVSSSNASLNDVTLPGVLPADESNNLDEIRNLSSSTDVDEDFQILSSGESLDENVSLNISQDSEDKNFMLSNENSFSLKSDLRSWSLEYNIPQNALSALLKMLQPYVSEDIPSDARTLLKTKRHVE